MKYWGIGKCKDFKKKNVRNLFTVTSKFVQSESIVVNLITCAWWRCSFAITFTTPTWQKTSTSSKIICSKDKHGGFISASISTISYWSFPSNVRFRSWAFSSLIYQFPIFRREFMLANKIFKRFIYLFDSWKLPVLTLSYLYKR